MKHGVKVLSVFMLALGFLFSSIVGLYADETSEATLELLINKGIISQKEVDKMKAKVVKEKPTGERGFLSIKGVEFQLGGELEYEFVDTGSAGSEDKAHFQLDKFVLQPKVKIGDNLNLDAQIYFVKYGATDKAYLEEFHIEFSNLFSDTWVDAGLYERWVKSQYKRKLEAYPLVGTAFWRDDATTLTWGGEHENIYWKVSIGDGYELSNKQVSEDTAGDNDILHDNRSASGISDSMEYGINLGFKRKLFDGKIDVLGFYYVDKLSGDDITFLQAQFSNYASGSDKKNRLGVSIRYDLQDWRFAGQYITAEDGKLDRDAWVIEGGYYFKFSGRDREWFSGVMPIVSYGEMDIDGSYDRNASNPLSWDRQKTMLGLIFDMYKNTKLRLEYYINDEDTGTRDISNNEFLAQLEIKF